MEKSYSYVVPAYILYHCCKNNISPKALSIQMEYFGLHNKQHYSLLYNLYKELINDHNVTSEDLHNYRTINELDNWIHETYSDKESSLYDEFKKLNLKIQN